MGIGHGRDFVCHAVSVRAGDLISAEFDGFQFENRVFTEGDLFYDIRRIFKHETPPRLLCFSLS